MPSLIKTIARSTPLLTLGLLLTVSLPGWANPQIALRPVTDGLGRVIQVETIPKRLVIAGRGTQLLTGAVYLFPELSQRLVAVSRSRQTAGFFSALDPTFSEKTPLERDVTVEDIVATQPDMVILKSELSASLGQSLEALGIPVTYLDLETPEHYQRDLAVLGSLAQNPERAQELQTYFRTQMGRVKTALPSPLTRPSVLILNYDQQQQPASVQVPAPHWLQTSLTRLAGGDPVWTSATRAGVDKGWIPVDVAQIAAWDPDFIFVIDYFGDPAAAVATLTQDPQWQTLKAVQNQRLRPFAKDLVSWDQPDPRWILGLSWLTTQLHPQTQPSLNLESLTQDFFVTIYDMDASTYEQTLRPTLKTVLP
ncbi:MAG: hypothetical protein OHK0012_00030 [Synechococcales cyanobacterium]